MTTRVHEHCTVDGCDRAHTARGYCHLHYKREVARCPVSEIACVLDADTDTSRPGRSCTSTPGLADQKDTDRLMDIMNDPTDGGQPRPALCPVCGLTSDNGVARHSEVTTLVTYVCTLGHLFAVTWVEVA